MLACKDYACIHRKLNYLYRYIVLHMYVQLCPHDFAELCKAHIPSQVSQEQNHANVLQVPHWPSSDARLAEHPPVHALPGQLVIHLRLKPVVGGSQVTHQCLDVHRPSCRWRKCDQILSRLCHDHLCPSKSSRFKRPQKPPSPRAHPLFAHHQDLFDSHWETTPVPWSASFTDLSWSQIF